MWRLSVVTTGTLFGRVVVRSHEEGLVLAPELLERLGVRDGDVLEIHTDGQLLILTPSRDGAITH